MPNLRELKALYRQGHNITQVLRNDVDTARPLDEIIEIAYDLQAGSYTAATIQPEYRAYLDKYSAAITQTLESLCTPQSLLEAGVGEATTFAGVLARLRHPCPAYGFDLSWSRLACSRRWLQDKVHDHVTLCTGNLIDIPLKNDAIDVVYTSHSIEPNGGQEARILAELYRVTGRYLVLLEPGYELATAEARQRMDAHGYCKNLVRTARSLGMKVLEHRLFDVTANPLNPTAITVIEKSTRMRDRQSNRLACPEFKTPLLATENVLYSPEALKAFPIIDNIPCLRREQGILASNFEAMIATSEQDAVPRPACHTALTAADGG